MNFAALRLLAFCVALFPFPALAAGVPASRPANDAPSDETKLPVIQGKTFAGKTLSTSSFAGKRLILFCFNPGVDQAAAYADALAKVAPERDRYNFAVAGVALGLDPAAARTFIARHKLDFPVFDDSDGDITAELRLQSPLVMVGTDAEGHVGMAMALVEHDAAAPAAAIEARLREFLRLPKQDAAVDGRLEQPPLAPAFDAKTMGGGDRISLASLKGRPVLLVFFQPTCPHCRDALRFFKGELPRLPSSSRPVLVGVSIDSRSYAVQPLLEAEQLDYFPVLEDPEHRIAEAYGSFAGVPDIVMIDKTGRIVFRDNGWNEKHDPDLMRMRLARLAGAEVPMALDRDGFSTSDACAVCHPSQAATWRYTAHSVAFESLVTRGEDANPKCVGCHVVGYGQKGGYSEKEPDPHLENVGCENCHGRGGGHLDAARPRAASLDLKPACEKCHDPQHSLGFDYATFLPKVSHAAILALGDAERAKLVAGRGQPRDLLPTGSKIAGSSACQRCHQKEYETWSKSAHARAIESLRTKGKDGEAKCLRCHVTGYGRPGGVADGARARSGEDLARVGCESCHGAGGEHVDSEGKRLGGIVRLSDKCESCVILKICGSCHDEANDPGFQFNVARKIEAQRHGSRATAAAAH